MTSLVLSDISKSFGNVCVLDAVSLAIEDREFIAFLGPSGSGKSTLLRIIAGLETADTGDILLGGQRIDGLPPGERGVAMVFQHYALYPHMTVAENMAFGLRNAGVERATIEARVSDAARVLEIEPLLDRKPGQLSGGQRQRVAIGRAIVKQPRLFLLDEPLSNLDAALRNRTRLEIAQLRARVDASIIMVTHDQAEAMTLADRMVVMNDSRIQQTGAPMDVYARPANRWVAQFVGSPAMTIAPATLIASDSPLARVRMVCGAEVATRVSAVALPPGELEIGLRAEAVRATAPGGGSVDAEVMLVERLGDRTLVFARLSDGQEIVAEDVGTSSVRMGDRIGLAIDGDAAHLFDAEGRGHHPDGAA